MGAPIFLYSGPEAGEKNTQIDVLKQSLKQKYGSSDDYIYYGTDLDVNEVVSKLMTESLFTPATFILIKNAELIKDKKDIDLLEQWCKTAEKSDASVLVLVTDDLKADSKLEKIIPLQNKKVFWEMFEDRKEQWLLNFFKKNGYSIQMDAVSSILEMVENNTEQLKNECSRFFYCFPQNHTITEEDVEQILAHNREESAFTLFDSMLENLPVNKKLENSLLILQKIRMSKKDSESVVIIAGLTYCFRKLALWKSIQQNGEAVSEVELKKNGFTSKTSRKQYEKASRIWTSGQVASILSILAKTDEEIRSTGTAFQNTELSLMLYEIIAKKGAYCSKYEIDL